MLKGLNEALDSSNKTPSESLSKGNLGRFYAPVTIETESERESATFGKMTLADEIKSVVLPTRGLIAIGYMAKWKSSVAGAGRAAVFLEANQLKNPQTASAVEVENTGTEYNTLSSSVNTAALASAAGAAAFTTTGNPISASSGSGGGLAYIFASAGTYNISIQFRATSGKVFAKERTLWVGVIGV